MRRSRSLVVLSVVAAGLLAACDVGSETNVPPPTAASGRPTPTVSSSEPSSVPTPNASPTSTSVSPTEAVTPAPAAPNTVSIPALVSATYDGGGLTLGRETGSTAAYRQYLVSYTGDGLTISGRMNIPRTGGPFPAVVLAHGYADPAVYDSSTQMARERDYLARQGYVTLLVDYRNHASSSKDPDNDAGLRLGYTTDVVNAALALQAYPGVDGSRLALVGRSMGGGVLFNTLVVKPGLFRAAVAYSPVSSDAADNFRTWDAPDPVRARGIVEALGTPDAQPAAWAQASPRTFFDRITEPVLVHHGIADLSCPIAWSDATVTALRQAGKSVDYQVYPGQPHVFTTQWQLSIERTTAFLRQHLA